MMKKIAAIALVTLLSLSGYAWAEGSAIKVTDVWAMATPPGAKTGVVYMAIENTGDQDDRLLSAKTEAATTPQLHTMNTEDGIMQMRELKDGISIPAHGKAALSPDGAHLMLIDLTQTLVAGKNIKLTLQFEKTGAVAATADIKPIGYFGDKK